MHFTGTKSSPYISLYEVTFGRRYLPFLTSVLVGNTSDSLNSCFNIKTPYLVFRHEADFFYFSHVLV